MDKAVFFDKLYSLQESSDEEEDDNQAREFSREREGPLSSPFPSSTKPMPERRNRVHTQKLLTIQRTTSAPVSSASVVKETPGLASKTSLLRHDVSFSEISKTSFSKDTSLPGPAPNERPTTERRTVSTPTIGSVVMKNSTGIASMLKDSKKRKRKEPSMKLVLKHERIFNGQTFYFIPPNDVAPQRRSRITKARNLGAVWANEWLPNVTHIVVDKAITYKEVMLFIKSELKMEALPPSTVLVNEDYPIDCAQFKHLLNPTQPQYLVEGSIPTAQQPKPEANAHKLFDKLLEFKQKSNSRKSQSPTRTQKSTQERPELSKYILMASREAKGASWLLDSPTETSPAREMRQPVLRGDDLDKMIETVRKLEHLPLDDEEDDDGGRPSTSDDPENSNESGSEGERAIAVNKMKRKLGKKGTFNQESFSCMKGGTGLTLESNPNRRTIEVLQEMADYYEQTRDTWRVRAYRMAIGTLKKQTIKISTYDEACNLPAIGNRLAEKIQEIVLTNGLRRLDNAKLEPNYKVLSLFLKIYGVGVNLAWKWIQAGHRTLEDLQTHVPLTANFRIGIEHYNDFITRIPRQEVTALGEIVKKASAATDPDIEVIIGGSYRRGASNSGDIDCLLTKAGTSSSHHLLPFLYKLIDRLTLSGFLVAALAVPRDGDGTKWHGACVLPGSTNPIWRRIDFLLVPASELGAALIYFTGDDIFNRSIRLLSRKKGWRLNQRGLYKDVLRGLGGEKLNEGALIEGADEKNIFEVLGVPWREPEDRICH